MNSYNICILKVIGFVLSVSVSENRSTEHILL